MSMEKSAKKTRSSVVLLHQQRIILQRVYAYHLAKPDIVIVLN